MFLFSRNRVLEETRDPRKPLSEEKRFKALVFLFSRNRVLENG
jgi:hypothetical protein